MENLEIIIADLVSSTQAHAAEVYAQALRDGLPQEAFAAMNAALTARWSRAGMLKVKSAAWWIVECEAAQ